MTDRTPKLTDDEMLEILKEIARTSSNAAARIAAVKELRAIGRDEKPVKDGFAGLYDVDNPGRLKVKKAS
jgi:hypothetical protein